MTAKEILVGDSARHELARGLDALANTVRVTLGPCGRTVAIARAAWGAYEDLVTAGVVDATMVVRLALENAASVASMLLTTEVAIVDRAGAWERPR